jgi:transposase
MINAADLPNDIDALKALLLARDEKILGLEAQLNTRATEIEHLKLMIAKLRRMQFGRKSEKVDHQIEQLELQLEDLQADEAVAEREMPEADRAPRRKSVRRPLPDHLPRDEKIYAPGAEACPACGGGLRPLGEDVAEQLEYVPASFRVIHHVRPKLACSCCDAIVQAPAPSRPIERGIAGPGLLAHVLVAKFADHLPLYRQAVIYARDGVDLDRALLASWVGAASALLRPLVDAIRHHVLAGAKLHADDTPIPVLAPGNGKTKTARLWTYVRDDRPSGDTAPPAVWFAYTPDRKGIHPQTHLANYEGVLQADAYAGYVVPEFMLGRRARVRNSPVAADSCPHIKSDPRFRFASETPSTKAVWPHDVAQRAVPIYRRLQAPLLSAPGLPRRRYASCPRTHVPARLGSY